MVWMQLHFWLLDSVSICDLEASWGIAAVSRVFSDPLMLILKNYNIGSTKILNDTSVKSISCSETCGSIPYEAKLLFIVSPSTTVRCHSFKFHVSTKVI